MKKKKTEITRIKTTLRVEIFRQEFESSDVALLEVKKIFLEQSRAVSVWRSIVLGVHV